MRLKLIVLMIYAAFSVSCSEQRHPSDASLEEVFRRHEVMFDQLISMTKSDSKLTRIAYDFTMTEDTVRWPRPESELGFSEDRWDRYRELFDSLDLNGGFWRRPGSDVRYFIASSKDVSSKGFVYSIQDLSPLSDTLEQIPPELWSTSSDGTIYKRIRERWYLFYRAN